MRESIAETDDETCSEPLDLSDVGEALRRDVARVQATLEEAREVLCARTMVGVDGVGARTRMATRAGLRRRG